MKKNTLRSLSSGFLLSALILASYAVFVQGQVPGRDLNLSDLLSPTVQETSEETKKEVSSLIEVNESLQDENKKMQESLTKLASSQKKNSESKSSDESNQNESQDESENDSSQSTSESSVSTSNQGDQTNEPAVEGTFTISEGESASEITQRLESEGYIESAADLEALIDQWDLSSVIVADSYQLNSDMSIHDIASLITGGAYYYY